MRFLVTIAVIVLVLTIGIRIFWLFAPFLAAYLMAWLLRKAVDRISSKVRLSRRALSTLTSVGLFLASFALIAWLIYLVTTEAVTLTSSSQSLLSQATGWFEDTARQMTMPFADSELGTKLNELVSSASESVTTLVHPMTTALMTSLTGWAKKMPSIAFGVFMFIIATFFFYHDFDRYHERFSGALSRNPDHPVQILKEIIRSVFSGYFTQAVLVSTIIMMIDLVGLLLLRTPYAALLAILMGIMDFLPYVGSGTILIPWGIVAIRSGEPLLGVGLLALYCVVGFVRHWLIPRYWARYKGLGSFVGLISAFLCWKFFGIGGLLLGPALVMLVVNVYQSKILDPTIRDLKLACEDIRSRIEPHLTK